MGSSIEGLSDHAIAHLADHLARLKHDLGKYIALQQRWLPDDPGEAALREALIADLLHTRRGPDGSTPAAAVWDQFASELGPHAHDPDVSAISAAMDTLRQLAPTLTSANMADLLAASAACKVVAERCRILDRRLRGIRSGRGLD